MIKDVQFLTRFLVSGATCAFHESIVDEFVTAKSSLFHVIEHAQGLSGLGSRARGTWHMLVVSERLFSLEELSILAVALQDS